MSTILKALRRVESDKNSQVRRPLRQEVVGGAETRRRFPVVWVAAGVFTAGLAIGAAALFLWPADFLGSSGEEPDTSPPAVAAADTPTSRTAPTAPDRARQRPRPPTPRRRAAATREPAPAAAARTAAPPPEPDVAVVRQISPTPLRVQDAQKEPEEVPRAPLPGEVRPGAEAMKPKPRPPAPTRVASARAAAPQPAARPAPPAPKPRASVVLEPEDEAEPEVEPAPSPPPPVRRRAGVPVILVSQTQWHPSPERREAVIEVEMADGSETRRVHEGDAVGSLVVERIEPSGVVFDYDGVELRHAVGSGP